VVLRYLEECLLFAEETESTFLSEGKSNRGGMWLVSHSTGSLDQIKNPLQEDSSLLC